MNSLIIYLKGINIANFFNILKYPSHIILNSIESNTICNTICNTIRNNHVIIYLCRKIFSLSS